MKNTPLFLRYLTEQMHERVAGSLVLWYDSVVDTGHLRWQNELNQNNRWSTDTFYLKGYIVKAVQSVTGPCHD